MNFLHHDAAEFKVKRWRRDMRYFLRRLLAVSAIAAGIAGPAAVHAENYTIKMALIAQPGQPVELGAQKFRELVEKNSKGQVKVQIFPGGQLGGEIELQDSVANGTIQMASIGTPVTSGKLKKLDILNMYYLWKSRDHLRKVIEGPIGKELFDEYEKNTGIHVLAMNWQQGTRQTLSKKKVARPADFKGLKIRTAAGVPVHTQLWIAMGANPVPLAFPEAYSAMQTGVIDAVELPLDWIYKNGFHKLGKYLLLTNHLIYVNLPIINARYYNAMPKDLKAVIASAAIEAGAFQTSIVLKQQDEIQQMLKDAGIEVVETQQKLFSDSVRPVFEKNMANWGVALYTRIMKAGE
jgi:tripartite ATP-independent transporter DctP family solute receptor